MKKTSLLILGALMATMSLTVFANEKGTMMEENINNTQTERTFRIVSNGAAQTQQLDTTKYNNNMPQENGRPPFVEGGNCCSNGGNFNYR